MRMHQRHQRIATGSAGARLVRHWRHAPTIAGIQPQPTPETVGNARETAQAVAHVPNTKRPPRVLDTPAWRRVRLHLAHTRGEF